uniref:PNPLA domain-containing protein n=1 Tax=Caenorhabditis japonica TaxID=281687 RepID=A0A8R1IPE1_CAEJA
MRISSRISSKIKGFNDVSKIALSFSGSGFLGAYNFGAAKRLMQEDTKIAKKVDRFAGASAGSLVAAILVLAPEKIDASVETLYAMADEVNSKPFGAMTPGYYLNEELVKIVDDFLPKDVSRAEGTLHVSVTKLKTWENLIISRFDSREHLIKCLLASCYIPMYSMGYRGLPPIINDE